MMSEKIRSLRCGMPAGLRVQEIDGKEYIRLSDVPFELEDIVCRWLMAVPEEHLPQILFNGSNLTLAGWSAFLSWMTAALNAEQRAPDFASVVRAQIDLKDLD